MTDTTVSKSFSLNGRKVRLDAYGRVCLNDIHKAGRFTKNQTPSDWAALEVTKRLIVVTIGKTTGKSGGFSKNDVLSVYCARVGRNGGIWVHPNLALAYAKYLSADLHYQVNEIFLQYKSGDATLADEVLQKASPAANEWAATRAMGRAERSKFTGILAAHDVKTPLEFAMVTNGTYIGLHNKTAKSLKIERNLSKKDNLRDNFDMKELTFIMAAEHLAGERIDDTDARGANDCTAAARKSATFIREAIERDRADRRRLV